MHSELLFLRPWVFMKYEYENIEAKTKKIIGAPNLNACNIINFEIVARETC